MATLPRMACPADDDYALWLELLALKPSPALLQAIGDFLEHYLRQANLNLYIMGLSGGIDSSFLAALMHARGIPYVGFCLPTSTNTPAETKRGLDVARAYGASSFDENASLQDLTTLYQYVSHIFSEREPQSSPLAEGNLKARLRMLFLYHVAQLKGGCVLSTDQLDELLTGFWTLHGDVGDVSPLQLIPKTVEYALARLLCAQLRDPAPLIAAIDAVPTDGLGISRSDLEQLGVVSYAELEEIFRQYFLLSLEARSRALSPRQAEEYAALRQRVPVMRFLRSGFKRSGAVLFDPRSA